jgi:hypothetical protein
MQWICKDWVGERVPGRDLATIRGILDEYWLIENLTIWLGR